MPFHLPFFPYYWKPNYRNTYNNQGNTDKNIPLVIQKEDNTKKQKDTNKEDSNNRNNSYCEESSEYFFEIFGLKLYFDDILIICILYFLYTEGVQDQELFICLILLLLS